jgi:hypothetical protein
MPNNPCFLFHVYQDEPLAERLMMQLRNFYPDATDIICLSDGQPASRFVQNCDRKRVTYLAGNRLKRMATGAAWIERMMTAFLTQSKAQTLIKLDPDSQVHRSFTAIPTADWFGQINLNGFYRPRIRGGCVGFSRDLATKILAGSFLENPIYRQLPFGYQRYGTFRKPGETASDEWISSTDSILADICFRLGIEPTPWSEVCIHFREPLPADLSPYAVTHPHPHAL